MYQKLNLNTKEHLAHHLGVPLALLEMIRSRKATHYHPKKTKIIPGAKPPRPIVLLSKPAKQLLGHLNTLLQTKIGHPAYMHGGLEGRSIKSNAQPHHHADSILKLDIKSFFPSVTPAMVFKALEQHAGIYGEAAEWAADLSTFEEKLITGSPASAIIASLVIREGTERIAGLVNQYRGRLSIYVDDLTISGGKHLRAVEGRCIEWLEETGVRVHPKKRIRQSGPTATKIITGIDVTNGRDAPSGFRAKFKAMCAHLLRKVEAGQLLTEKERASFLGRLNHLKGLNAGMAEVYKRRYEQRIMAAPYRADSKPPPKGPRK